ncbi:hypothetical protein SO802_033327 [Lithocarpus litseifolius]|uniref:Uncharacterized protein n=1 Tax=Lithocarpus litseifolius TaxID=425828 RepID=A0AAW2BD87_9ROSI
MHKVSTQDVQPPVCATRGPSKYLDVWDLPNDQVFELPLNSMHQPVDEGKIGKAWRDHKCRLKTSHYILHPRNKARVKNSGPEGCILEDWDVLVDHWYTDDAVIESEKNRDRRSKQEDLHTLSSCSFAMHAAKKAKVDGCPVEHAVLYLILHTRKDGSAVNPIVQAKIGLDQVGSRSRSQVQRSGAMSQGRACPSTCEASQTQS